MNFGAIDGHQNVLFIANLLSYRKEYNLIILKITTRPISVVFYLVSYKIQINCNTFLRIHK